MKPALGPVEACSSQGPAPRSQLVDIDSQATEPHLAFGGGRDPSGQRAQEPALAERAEEVDGGFTGEMVVADARAPEVLVVRAGRTGPLAPAWGDGGEGLERRGDLRTHDAEVAMPT